MGKKSKNIPSQLDDARLEKLAVHRHLDLIVLFGSYAKGQTRPGSDIDVAVRMTREAFKRLAVNTDALWQWEIDLLADLDEIFDGTFDIDLVLLNRVFDSTFLFEIARYGILVYESEPTTFHCFRSYAARRFDDDAKFRRLGWEYLKRRCLDGERSV